MPKVSQQYRDARREQILAAARRCFVRDGFHATSMQNLFAEAGLSSGAVYRYFSSKEDVILAIAEENLSGVVAAASALAGRQPGEGLGTVLAGVLEIIRAKHAENDLAAIALLVWSEALRNPALAGQLQAASARMRADLAGIVSDHQDRGDLPKDASADAIAALLLAVVPGFILSLAILGPQVAGELPGAARALWPG